MFLFAVWCLSIAAAATQVRVEDIRQGTPKELRCSVSILPVIPVFPLFFWIAALFFDQILYKISHSLGTKLIGGLHTVFALILLVSIIRDLRFLQTHYFQD
jgi:hypothetical protein